MINPFLAVSRKSNEIKSDDPQFLRFLVQEGIDSLSLNFDTFARGRINTWRTEIIEAKVDDNDKITSYRLVNDCDELIDKIRVPRGRLRNMVRKQLKEINPKMKASSEKLDKVFKELHDLTFNFVKEINTGEIKDFENHYNKYSDKLSQIVSEIPNIRK